MPVPVAARRMPRRSFARRLFVPSALAACAAGTGFAAETVGPAADLAAVRTLLDSSCVDCHGEFYAESGLRLDAAALDLSDLTADRLATLVKVHDRVAAGEMPPEDGGGPLDAADAHGLTSALAVRLHEADHARQCELGRTRLRRLSRTEYAHAVQDLLRVDVPLRGLLPGDAVAHGFDKTVDALGTSSVLVNGYLDAARAAVDAAAAVGPRPETVTSRHSLLDEHYADRVEGRWRIWLPLEDAVALYASDWSPSHFDTFAAPAPGEYRVRVSAYAYNNDPVKAAPVVYRASKGWYANGDRATGTAGLDFFAARPKPADAGPDWEPPVEEFTVTLAENETVKVMPHDVGHRIWNEQSHAKDSDENALAVRWVEITGPIVEQWPPASFRTLFGENDPVVVNAEEAAAKKWVEPRYEVHSDDPLGDAKRQLKALASRAFRRPLVQGELKDLSDLLAERHAAGESYEEIVKLGATAVLCDPAFLTVGGECGRRGGADAEPLGPHGQAARLALMLWGSVPDVALRAAADDGSLADPAVYRAHAERLLADPRHERFTADFLDQWLDLAWIDASTPDPELAPEYDDALRPAMVEETRRTFEHMLAADRPAREIADADWAILNRRLAEHYDLDPDALGLPVVGYEKVSLPESSVRGGFVTQAAIAKVTANGTHTSPVLRGQFVMDAIVGSPIPPPPPGVPAVEPDVRGAETLRQKLEAHRADPACATCHRKMDPAGFALESLDVVGTFRARYRAPKGDGEWRTKRVGNREVNVYEALPVDSAAELPDGRAFADLKQFKALLASDDRQLARSLAEKWLVYGTGEGVTFADRRAIERILDEAEPADYGLRTLLLATVCSDAFKRR